MIFEGGDPVRGGVYVARVTPVHLTTHRELALAFPSLPDAQAAVRELADRLDGFRAIAEPAACFYAGSPA